SSGWNAITVGQFYPPDRGRYRIRISANGVQTKGKPATFRVDVGPMLMGTKNHLVDYFDVPEDKPTIIEFVDHFEARNHIRIHPEGVATGQPVERGGAEKQEGQAWAVRGVEAEAPPHDPGPRESPRRIFGALPRATAPDFNNRNRVEVVSKNPEVDAER